MALLVAACGPWGESRTATAVPSVDAVPGGPSAVDSGAPLAVLGTENFYADLLARIGGSRVQATSLLDDPNADPHAFESSPKDAALVADAKLVIVNGLGYDDFMEKLLGASTEPDRIVVNVQELLGLPGDVNAHIWYDPSTMPKVAEAATDALSSLDPQNADYFAAREQAYVASLKPISARITGLKATYAGAPIAVTENVAGYLTDRIGLVIKTPVGFMKAIEEGTDPAPADVAAQQDLFTSGAVRALLYNSQVTSPATRSIRDLAIEHGVPIVGMAETIPAEDHGYVAWQLAELGAVEQALGAAT